MYLGRYFLLLATCSAIIAGQGVVGRANLDMHDGKDAAWYETCLPHAAPSLLLLARAWWVGPIFTCMMAKMQHGMKLAYHMRRHHCWPRLILPAMTMTTREQWNPRCKVEPRLQRQCLTVVITQHHVDSAL